MNRDVFASILAMDSYNRDYGAGLKVTGKKLGSAQSPSSKVVGRYQSVAVDALTHR